MPHWRYCSASTPAGLRFLLAWVIISFLLLQFFSRIPAWNLVRFDFLQRGMNCFCIAHSNLLSCESILLGGWSGFQVLFTHSFLQCSSSLSSSSKWIYRNMSRLKQLMPSSISFNCRDFFGTGMNFNLKQSRNTAAAGRDLPGVKPWKVLLVRWEKQTSEDVSPSTCCALRRIEVLRSGKNQDNSRTSHSASRPICASWCDVHPCSH